MLAAAVGLLLSLYGPAIPELRATYGVGGARVGAGAQRPLRRGDDRDLPGGGWSGAWPPGPGWLVAVRPAGRRGGRDRVRPGVAGRAGGGVRPRGRVRGGGGRDQRAVRRRRSAERATAMLNLLGACFGAGAVLGPAGRGRHRWLPGAVRRRGPAGRGRPWPSTRDLPSDAPGPGGPAPRGGRPVAVVGGFVALTRAVRWGGERDRRLGDDQPAGRRRRARPRRPAGRPATGRPSPPGGCWPSRWPCG